MNGTFVHDVQLSVPFCNDVIVLHVSLGAGGIFALLDGTGCLFYSRTSLGFTWTVVTAVPECTAALGNVFMMIVWWNDVHSAEVVL